MDSLYGKPYGVNYAPSTPLPKGIRSTFAHNVVGAVGIRVDVPAIRRSVQPALHPLAAKRRDMLVAKDRQRVCIEETGLAGVTLLSDLHLDAHQVGLVGEHVDETGMRDAHKGLIVAPSHVRFLLPERVLTDAQ